jgi:hypothetical protein
MDTDVPLNAWTKEFEFVGIKNEDFLDALRIALLKKNKNDSADRFISYLKNDNE